MNPYTNLSEKSFWRSAIADLNIFDIHDLWDPKFAFDRHHNVSTFGSCFAQHFSRALITRGYNWYNAEPGPAAFSPAVLKKYGYGVFSARTGNIYTVRAFKQWLMWAFGKKRVPSEFWQSDGRFFDPFRPTIFAGGFDSAEDVVKHRKATLAAVKRAVMDSDRLVFTLGLTEAWENRRTGVTYAMCPGTVAGRFDADLHRFKNFTFAEIGKDLEDVLGMLRKANRDLRILLTVSPVPLTATASSKHVLVATTHSKSVLRAVAGTVVQDNPTVDYFPSYEIVATTPFKGIFYAPNARSVTGAGVDFVMDSFFSCLSAKFGDEEAEEPCGSLSKRRLSLENVQKQHDESDDDVCDDAMLGSFGR